MSMLDKFANVEVKTDCRISEDDKLFCEAHQQAYEEARTTLQELRYFWESVLDAQKQKLAPFGETRINMYLSDNSNLCISIPDIEKQLRKMHGTLIWRIVHHFNEVYRIAIDATEVERALLPEEPRYRRDMEYEKDYEKYKTEMLEMSLTYDKIVEQIFVQTDGRGLWEQALQQIKDNAHEAAWVYGNPKFERKKHTIQFSGFVYGDRELRDNAKKVLTALAHFETEKIGIIPNDFSPLMEQRRLYWETFEFDHCTKVKKLRVFRNGRMDVRFSEEAHAVKFIDTYLGTMA